jgi:hypothetical protein
MVASVKVIRSIRMIWYPYLLRLKPSRGRWMFTDLGTLRDARLAQKPILFDSSHDSDRHMVSRFNLVRPFAMNKS